MSGQGNVTLCQEVTAVGQEFRVTWDEAWQRLVNPEAQIRVEVIERLAIRIHGRDHRAIDPFVASSKPRPNAGHSCGKAPARALAIAHRQLVSYGRLRGVFRRG